VSFRVALRRNSDGLVRMVDDAADWDDGGEYGWHDGNLACDDNRAKQFAWAADEQPPDEAHDVPHECDRGVYTALFAVLPDGRTVPMDGARRVDCVCDFLSVTHHPDCPTHGPLARGEREWRTR
jgi:hypothetical protein